MDTKRFGQFVNLYYSSDKNTTIDDSRVFMDGNEIIKQDP